MRFNTISLATGLLSILFLFGGCKKEVKFEANDETSLRYFGGGGLPIVLKM